MQDIASINDHIRKSIPYLPHPHRMFLSASVAALSKETTERLFHDIRSVTDFPQDDDPYGERDFGSVTVDGNRFYWKFDYLDDNFEYFRLNGNRSLTIMAADEY